MAENDAVKPQMEVPKLNPADPHVQQLLQMLAQMGAAALQAPLEIEATDGEGHKKVLKISLAGMVSNISMGQPLMVPMPVQRNNEVIFISPAQMLCEIMDNTHDTAAALERIVAVMEAEAEEDEPEDEEPPPRRRGGRNRNRD